jgi:SAM-dependent methyltransferase
MIRISHCSVCGGELGKALDLETYPLLTSACPPDARVPLLPIVTGYCRRCSHVQLMERPTPEQLDLIYLGDYTNVMEKGVLSSADQMQLDCKAFFDFADGGKLPVDGKVLEIGCFDGSFLALFEGRRLLGCEPNPMGRMAAERYGVEVVPRYFSAADFERSSIDLVVMRHLIEHLPEPLKVLEACRQIIRPEGRLLIETPNIEHTLAHHVVGSFYHQHLHYFSRESLPLLLRSTKFEIVAHGMRDFRQFVVAVPAGGGTRELLNDSREPYAVMIRSQIDGYRRYLEALRLDMAAWLAGNPGRIAIYGASSTATGIVYAGGLPPARLAYLVDADPRKHGKVLPGTGRAVFAPEHLREDPVETVFIASDFFKEEIKLLLKTQFPGVVKSCILSHPHFVVETL